MTLFRNGSIRTHIIVMVLGGAIIPLALIGAWATRSAVRSGKALLREQLENAADGIARTIAEKWQFRRGELLLLAGTSAALNLLRTEASAADSQYLAGLRGQFASVVTDFSYRRNDGSDSHEVWSSADLPLTEAAAGPGARSTVPVQTIDFTMPVSDAAGSAIGSLHARIALPGLFPTDSARLPVPGASIDIREPARSTQLAADTGEVMRQGVPAIAVRRTVDEPALEITVSAPTAAYVAPFQRTGRATLAAVGLVAAVTLLITVVLTARITMPLQRLAQASESISRGELHSAIRADGPREIASLASSFDAMRVSLKRTMDELARRSALAAIGEFAASLAHEVRNGLTSVKIDLQRAEERLEPASSSQELVARALFAVTRLNATVTGALQVARAGSITLQPVNLNGVLTNAVNRAAPLFQASNANVTVVPHAADITVQGDADALEQLFFNLLLNAAQAVGGNGSAHVRSQAENGRIVVDITDTGSGIVPEQLDKVMEPFYTTRPGGTGLGLPIARQIAIAHGGSLTLESTPDAGTTARVILPGVD